MNRLSIYYGAASTPEKPVTLTCGPLSCVYQTGMIRSVCYNSIELVRRIYVAVRDRHWNSIPFTINDINLHHSKTTFTITFNAQHSQNEIVFMWNGVINGHDDGSLEFNMDGRSLSTFERNRIGLCVLLPLSLSGKSVTVHSADGLVNRGSLPGLISPHQPFKSIQDLEVSVSDTLRYKLSFKGDTFEMEDQRNWTDASYKIYSTPLDLPLPVTIEQNIPIFQSITICPERLNDPVLHSSTTLPVTISIPPQSDHVPFPAIGLMMGDSETPGPEAIERIQALKLPHCRVDVVVNDRDMVSEVQSAAAFCAAVKTDAELALYCESVQPDSVERLKNALALSAIPVKRFLLYDQNKVTSQATLNLFAPVCKQYAPSATIASGTDNYFVELNRNHPSLDTVDELCYSVNPQVHTFDSAAIMENLPGITETLKTALLFNQMRDIVISPLTLRPRKNRKNPMKAGGNDLRQSGLFCAAWTLGALLHCIAGGAKSVTLYETTGDNGTMLADGSEVYPAYSVLLWCAGLTSAPVSLCESTDQSRVVAMVVKNENVSVILLANLTEDPQKISVEGLPSEFVTNVVNEETVLPMITAPLAWSTIDESHHISENGSWEAELLPYSVMRITYFC